MQPVSTRPRPESPRPHVTRGRSSLSHGLARPWPRTGKVGLDSGLESSITDRNNVNYARKRILKIVFVEQEAVHHFKLLRTIIIPPLKHAMTITEGACQQNEERLMYQVTNKRRQQLHKSDIHLLFISSIYRLVASSEPFNAACVHGTQVLLQNPIDEQVRFSHLLSSLDNEKKLTIGSICHGFTHRDRLLSYNYLRFYLFHSFITSATQLSVRIGKYSYPKFHCYKVQIMQIILVGVHFRK